MARIAEAWAGAPPALTIVTSDFAPAMVEAALDAGMPALWQLAQRLLLRERSVDGVLCAYGTHHLDHASLVEACREARRVLKPEGRVVLHDFEPDSGVARWFSEVVHRHSLNGHAHPHYGPEVLGNALTDRGFEQVATGLLSDPIVAPGPSPEAARTTLALYLYQMYGLIGLGEGRSPYVQEQVLALAESTFGAVTVERAEGETDSYRACLPRVAAYAVGSAPAG